MKSLGTVVLLGLTAVGLMGQAATSTVAEAPKQRATVQRDNAPVYARMATASEVVAVLNRGAVVMVDFTRTGFGRLWCHVSRTERSKRAGYVRCEDLKRDLARWQEQPRVPPATVPRHDRPAPRSFLSGSTEVPIRMAHNLALVSVTLNRTETAAMVVDTGASSTFITPSVLRRLGLSIPDDAPRRQGWAVGGGVIEVPYVVLFAVQVGDAMITDFEVGVYDVFPRAPEIEGLLGADFLHKFKLTLDKAAREMHLSESQPEREAAGPRIRARHGH